MSAPFQSLPTHKPTPIAKSLEKVVSNFWLKVILKQVRLRKSRRIELCSTFKEELSTLYVTSLVKVTLGLSKVQPGHSTT